MISGISPDIEIEAKTEFAKAKGVPAPLKDSQIQIRESENRFKRREISLDETVRADLENQLSRIVRGWREDRSSLLTKLREWNDLYEGVVTETDFPWPGASHVHIPVPKIKVREIKSAIDRSTMRPVPFLHATYAGPDELYTETFDFVNDIEDFVEDKMKNATNVHQTLMESIIPIMRDGTCPIQITWDTEWERTFDFKLYKTVEEFQSDFPTATDAGLSEKGYKRVLDDLTLGTQVEIQYEYDVANYDGPRAYIVPLIDFVHWPVYVSTLEDTVVHGKRVWMTESRLQSFKMMNKFTDTKLVDSVIAQSGDEHEDMDLAYSRDNIEGISRQKNKQDSKEFEFFELIWKGALTEEDKARGIKRKYLIWFRERNENRIFRIEPYPIRKGRSTYFILRFVKRDNRLLGMSFMDDIADMSMEIDIIHRQRINSRTITHVPSFKAKDTAQGRFNPARADLRFRPGVVFWLASTDDVEQFDIRPVDLSGSIDDELILVDFINQVLGAIGQSGQANPIDPRAPARKEQQQLRQSTNRIDDYVAELLPTFAEIGQHFLDLYYQFGPNRVKFYAESKDGKFISKAIERTKLFNPNVMFRVNGTSVFMNPELEFSRDFEIYQILQTNPLTGQNPRIQRDSLGRLLRSSRVQDMKNLLPTDEEIGLPPGGKIPTEEERKFAAKEKMQERKESQRMAEQEFKHQSDIEKTLVETEAERSLAAAAPTVSPPAGIPKTP